MIIINYKSKRQLKKAIGKQMMGDYAPYQMPEDGVGFFVTNSDKTFKATVVMNNGIIENVR